MDLGNARKFSMAELQSLQQECNDQGVQGWIVDATDEKIYVVDTGESKVVQRSSTIVVEDVPEMPSSECSEECREWEVEAIVGHLTSKRGNRCDRRILFYVKWLGLNVKTFEPLHHLVNCWEILSQYIDTRM